MKLTVKFFEPNLHEPFAHSFGAPHHRIVVHGALFFFQHPVPQSLFFGLLGGKKLLEASAVAVFLQTAAQIRCGGLLDGVEWIKLLGRGVSAKAGLKEMQ